MTETRLRVLVTGTLTMVLSGAGGALLIYAWWTKGLTMETVGIFLVLWGHSCAHRLRDLLDSADD